MLEILLYSNYSDYSLLTASRPILFGGCGFAYANGSQAGIVFLWINESTSYAHAIAGSSTTYYSDNSLLYASRFLCFGGAYSYQSEAGIFYSDIIESASSIYSFLGSYYSDESFLCASRIARLGGDWGTGSSSGVLCLNVHLDVSYAGTFTPVGSITTYYSDNSPSISTSKVPQIGGSYDWGGSSAGLFCLAVQNAASFSKSTMGSATTYYSDDSHLYASCVLIFGGDCVGARGGYGSQAGMFLLYLETSESSHAVNLGSFLTLPSNYILQ